MARAAAPYQPLQRTRPARSLNRASIETVSRLHYEVSQVRYFSREEGNHDGN
jgi:hypothetical protein